MVRRNAKTQREQQQQQQLNRLLDESSDSDDEFDPRASSSRNSNRRDTARSPERRTNRNNSTSQQQPQRQQPSTSNRNQAGSSRAPAQASKSTKATTSQQQQSSKATGASKRKQGGTSAKSNFRGDVLHHIRFLQNSTEMLISKAPFMRVVKEVLHSHNSELRMTKECVEAIQQAAEVYLVEMFDDGNRLCLHRNRVTITPSDIQMLMYIRGQATRGMDPGVP